MSVLAELSPLKGEVFLLAHFAKCVASMVILFPFSSQKLGGCLQKVRPSFLFTDLY